MDGEWFEIGADYVRASRDAIRRLFPGTPTVDLPPWYLPRTGRSAITTVRRSASAQGNLCLDRNAGVRNPLGTAQQPGDLRPARPGRRTHPRQARRGSAPLSHLFSQGLISAQSLVAGRTTSASGSPPTVAGACPAGGSADDFTPRKVVYAILLESGKQLTPDTLFPFSQATLAHAARILGTTRSTSRSSASRQHDRAGRHTQQGLGMGAMHWPMLNKYGIALSSSRRWRGVRRE